MKQVNVYRSLMLLHCIGEVKHFGYFNLLCIGLHYQQYEYSQQQRGP